MNTPLTALLGIRHPILQGGMAWVADAPLAAAVSKAGGLGIIAAMNATPEWLAEQIAMVRAETDKPFGVNIMLMSPHAESVAKVVAEQRVAVVTTGAGNPTRFMPLWLGQGVKVLPVVPSVALARMCERAGASAIIAEGGESGGHVGDLTTMALVPQVVDAVHVPVVAAGGIADGRGLAAALMLGAAGVQMGTRFLASKECTIHEAYKQKVINAKDIDTMVTGRRLGHPVRALKSTFVRAFAEREADPCVTPEELEAMGGGALYKAARLGDMEQGSFMAGQISGLIREELPVEEIIEKTMAQAEALLRGKQ